MKEMNFKKLGILLLAIITLFGVICVTPEVKAATQVKATAVTYEKCVDFTSNYGAYRYQLLLTVDTTVSNFTTVANPSIYNEDGELMLMPSGHHNEIVYAGSTSQIRLYIWTNSIDASMTQVSDVVDEVITIKAGTTFGNYEFAEDFQILLNGESATKHVQKTPVSATSVKYEGCTDFTSNFGAYRYQLLLTMDTTVITGFDVVNNPSIYNADGEHMVPPKHQNEIAYADSTSQIRLYIWTNSIDASMTTPATVLNEVITIKAGTVFGAFEFAEDFQILLNGESATKYVPTTPVSATAVKYESCTDFTSNFGAYRYTLLLTMDTDAITNFDSVLNPSIYNADGKHMVPPKHQNEILYAGSSSQIRLNIWTNSIDASMTTPAAVVNEVITIKAGTVFGAFEFAEDFQILLNRESATKYVPKTTLKVSDVKFEKDQDFISKYGSHRYTILVDFDTEITEFELAEAILYKDGITKMVMPTGHENEIQYADSDTVRLYIWVNSIDSTKALVSEIENEIVVMKAGTMFGKHELSEDLVLRITGTSVSRCEKTLITPGEIPEQEGKLFVGWYANAKCTKPVTADATSGYAKFIDADVLSVKAQTTAGIDADSTEADIRFVSTIDNLNYSEVGFVIAVEGRETKRVSTTTVYEKLLVVDGEEVDTIVPSVFAAESKYFFSYSYWNVPRDYFNTNFTVTPYCKTLSGTIVYGETVHRRIANSTILSKDYTYTDEQRITPFWENSTMYNETMTMVQQSNGEIYGTLLFVPTKINAIVDVYLQREYIEGIDWEWVEGTNKIKWLEGSSIPYFTEYLLSGKNPDGSYISPTEWTDDGRIRYGDCMSSEAAIFFEKQISVSYTYDISQVQTRGIGYTEYQGNKLTNTLSKLKNNQDLKVLFYGDSIFSGCQSSSMANREPYMPDMHELIEARLQQETSGKVTVDNIAVGGWLSGDGLKALSQTVHGYNYSNSYQGYDLLIISFGMNDVSTSKATYVANMKGIVDKMRAANPNMEVIFVSCMNPNPRATSFCGNQLYQATWLREIAAESKYAGYTAVVDIYSIHKSILQYKSYSSTTSDNIHHPSDWLIRVYAQNILAAMIE